MSSHCLLAFMVSDKRSTVNLLEDPLCITSQCFLAAFEIVSLFQSCDYNISWCGCLWVYHTWDFLSFWICRLVSHQLGELWPFRFQTLFLHPCFFSCWCSPQAGVCVPRLLWLCSLSPFFSSSGPWFVLPLCLLVLSPACSALWVNVHFSHRIFSRFFL